VVRGQAGTFSPEGALQVAARRQRQRQTEEAHRAALARDGKAMETGGDQPRALDKLRMLDAAERLEDLQIPPSNRLEALKGKRAGQWGIRINNQWRICFAWKDGHAYEVEIVDYH
jgi:proteic killer suppression protein